MLDNMTIRSRLVFVIGLLSVLLIGIGSLGIYGMNKSNAGLKTVYEDRTVVAVDLATINDIWEVVRKNTAAAANSQDVAIAKAKSDETFSEINRAEEIWTEFMATYLVPEEARLANIKIELLKDYIETITGVFQLAIAGDYEAASKSVREDAEPIFTSLHATIYSMIVLQGEVAAEEYASAQSTFDNVFVVTLIAVGLGVIFAIVLGVMVIRAIVGPLDKAIAIADAVASGDLTSRIEVKSTNETGRLLHALKQMNDNLVDLVGKVRTSTDSITTASGEIASGNCDLSQRTEKQASSLEETASSMEELTSTVKQNADNARQANQLAAGASEVAVKGGSVVGEVVQTMNEINESSKKIVDITSVIDGIAFQTNILALNAAVEAARAGEQGRGFAVVATEVRTLAQRSAAAAKEIKKLISDSVNKVEDGTRLVDEAGSTMDEIVSSIKCVTDIMAEISSASQEQSAGIEQVNQAITQMDDVTQQNATLVEEATTAAESMQDQAQALTQAVTAFKLTGGIAPLPVKRIHCSITTIAKLPNRGPAKKTALVTDIESAKAKPRKATSS